MEDWRKIVFQSGSNFFFKKRLLVFALSFVVIILNAIDFFRLEIIDKEVFTNWLNIVVAVFVAAFVFFNKLDESIGILILVYFSIANLFYSQLVNPIDMPEYSSHFLRTTLFIGMMILFTGILCGHIHIIIIGVLYLVFFSIVLLVSRNQFLLSNAVVLVFSCTVYWTISYYIVFQIERDHKIQIEYNDRLSEFNFELIGNALRLEEANKILEEQKKQIEVQTSELLKLMASRDKFYSIISHDLKTPFNSMLGFSELVLREAEEMKEEKLIRYSELMHKSTRQTYNLLVNLLEWTRIQTGRTKVEPSSIHINNLIIQLSELFHPSFEAKSQNFEMLVNGDLKIYADANMIATILRNLLSNAIKFTPDGGAISLIADIVDLNLNLTVKDSGVGMTQSEIALLFFAENKFKKSGTNNESGSGLGLLLCKEFVNLHHGTLKVESKPGFGTEFIISIPVQYS